MALITTCPHCRTSFRLVADQLKLRNGLVRCGSCLAVFSGLEQMQRLDERGPASRGQGPGSADNDGAPDGDRTADNDGAPGGERTADGRGAPWQTGTWDDEGLLPDEIEPRRGLPALPDFDDNDALSVGRPGVARGEPPVVSDTAIDTDEPPIAGMRPAKPDETSIAGADTSDDTHIGADTDAETNADTNADTDADTDADPDTVDTARNAGREFIGHRIDHPFDDPAPRARGFDEPAHGFAETVRVSDVAGAGAGNGIDLTRTGGESADDGEMAIDYFSTDERRRGFVGAHAAWKLAAAAVLVLVLGLQGLLAQRDWLAARFPALEPAIALIASTFGLPIAPPRALDALSIESFELQTDSASDLLSASAIIHNSAGYVVRWPSMMLTLTDAQNRVLVRKAIDPGDYLGGAADQTLRPNSERPIRLALEARDFQPSGYSVELFYR